MRTLCETLEEMRVASKSKNFSYIDGLIEEIQTYGNRMEAALGEKKDYNYWYKERKKVKKEVLKLEKKHKIKSKDRPSWR